MSFVVNSLSFSYGQLKVLDNVSFTCGEGELISVLGCNGAGKSTLFKCMLGLLGSYTGSVLVNGNDLRSLSPRALASLVAYIPQSHYCAFNYSVFDMVLMGTAHSFSSFTSPGRAAREMAQSALHRIGIEELSSRSFSRISGGEQQLTLIARALAQNARALVLDEPTASLDFGNRARVLSCVKELALSGYCVLQSTHDPESAYIYSDRVLALKDGKVLSFGLPSEVMDAGLVSDIYEIGVKTFSLEGGSVRVFVPDENKY